VIDAIHQSMLNMFLRCGEQGRRRYIEKEIIPPGIALGRGTAVHSANKTNLRQKISSHQDLPLADLQDCARDGYIKSFKHGVYLPKEQISDKKKLLNEGLNDALRCTKVYGERVAPYVQPLQVEEPFEVEAPGLEITLAGRMDYQEKPTIGDLKSTTKAWAEGQIEKEIQVPFYSFAHEKWKGVRPEFVYHILIARRGKDGRPTSEDLQEQKMTVDDKHYNALFAKIRVFLQMLKTGTFPYANPSIWYCNPQYCGYYYTCPGQGNDLPRTWV